MVESAAVLCCPQCGSDRLVYVRYRDHVLFKSCSSKAVRPVDREAVGWIVKQNEEAIWLVWDRSVGQLGKESLESGLVVLRKDVLELKQFC